MTGLMTGLMTGGNRSTWRKPAMLGRVKLGNTLLTCDQGNFNQITARGRNRTLVTAVKDTCTTTVPPAPPKNKSSVTAGTVIKYKKNIYPGNFFVT